MDGKLSSGTEEQEQMGDYLVDYVAARGYFEDFHRVPLTVSRNHDLSNAQREQLAISAATDDIQGEVKIRALASVLLRLEARLHQLVLKLNQD